MFEIFPYGISPIQKPDYLSPRLPIENTPPGPFNSQIGYSLNQWLVYL